MTKELQGLWNPKEDAYGLAVFTVRMMKKMKGHTTTRKEVLGMQERAGRKWTEQEIQGILAANND